jgi:hypothetical protein
LISQQARCCRIITRPRIIANKRLKALMTYTSGKMCLLMTKAARTAPRLHILNEGIILKSSLEQKKAANSANCAKLAADSPLNRIR